MIFAFGNQKLWLPQCVRFFYDPPIVLNLAGSLTQDSLIFAGVRWLCWILPNHTIPTLKLPCRRGAISVAMIWWTWTCDMHVTAFTESSTRHNPGSWIWRFGDVTCITIVFEERYKPIFPVKNTHFLCTVPCYVSESLSLFELPRNIRISLQSVWSIGL